jgi:predicted TIM-barrel fold metal-dependent hydrolase
MIIDCHVHGGKGDRLTAPWNTNAPLETYLRRARAAGIGKSIVFPAGNSNYALANEQLARIIAQHPRRLIGFASINAVRDAGNIRQILSRAVHELGFRGVKVHGYDAMPTRELCDTVRDLHIPMLVDVVGRTQIVDLLASEYANVNFIIPHLGSFMDDFRAQQQVVDQLVRYPNVYTDTSGVRRFDYLVQAVRRAGAHKVLFGSDGPWLHPGVELHKIRMLKLPADAEALITGANIQRLICSTPHRSFNARGSFDPRFSTQRTPRPARVHNR